MAFERICFRTLPNGHVRKVYPFHVSLEGMAKLILCRDEEDYDVMVKYIFLCARRKNVIVIIYIAMSNHGHATILATGQDDADAFKVEWLRMYSQYFSNKYHQRKVLRHTHDSLDGVPWLVNAEGELEPASACDHEYLESAFGYDQAYFLRTIGTVNMAEMHQKLVDNPRQRQNDTEMLKTIESISQGWFKCGLLDLPMEKKVRLLPYIYRSFRTSIAQLARCFGLDPDKVARMVGNPRPADRSHRDEGKTDG